MLTTGSSDEFKVKNIYDVAGNLMEWTMEAGGTNIRIGRGGYHAQAGSASPASSIYTYYCYTCHRYIGFRPALYITNT